jgi:cytochrome c oxidase cbb3-type subunit 3
MSDKEKDALSGTDTTGHEWDGIKELNTPLPRWWLYTFYVCIVWAMIYAAIYPAWPTGLSDYTKGFLGYSSRAELADALKAAEAERAPWKAKFETASVTDVAGDQELLQYAMAGGRVLFAENCQPCHGAGGSGAHGYPALVDDDWLWGGTLDAIEETITVGIRSGHDEARYSEMPPFGDGILEKAEIATVADYVLSLSKGGGGAEGKTLFMDNCASCHGEDGKGMREMGAPDLADQIWLYGSSREDVLAQISKPQHGVMPSWSGRLDDVSIKQLAVYVHSLGGGQ